MTHGWHFSTVTRPLPNPLLGFLLHLSQFALRLLREFSHLGHGFDCVVTKLWNRIKITCRPESQLNCGNAILVVIPIATLVVIQIEALVEVLVEP